MNPHLKELRRILAKRFSEDDLRTLCFDLGMDYDDLPGRGKCGQARELVMYMHRHGRVSELEREIKRKRPELSFVVLEFENLSAPLKLACELLAHVHLLDREIAQTVLATCSGEEFGSWSLNEFEDLINKLEDRKLVGFDNGRIVERELREYIAASMSDDEDGHGPIEVHEAALRAFREQLDKLEVDSVSSYIIGELYHFACLHPYEEGGYDYKDLYKHLFKKRLRLSYEKRPESFCSTLRFLEGGIAHNPDLSLLIEDSVTSWLLSHIEGWRGKVCSE